MTRCLRVQNVQAQNLPNANHSLSGRLVKFSDGMGYPLIFEYRGGYAIILRVSGIDLRLGYEPDL